MPIDSAEKRPYYVLIETNKALEGETMKVSKMEYLELSEDHRKKAEESRSEYMRKFHLEQAEFWKKLASS